MAERKIRAIDFLLGRVLAGGVCVVLVAKAAHASRGGIRNINS
jgi:hypothetical protein